MRQHRTTVTLFLVATTLICTANLHALFGTRDAEEITEEIADIGNDLEAIKDKVLTGIDKNLRKSHLTSFTEIVGQGTEGSDDYMPSAMDQLLKKLKLQQTATDKYHARIMRDGLRLGVLEPLLSNIVMSEDGVLKDFTIKTKVLIVSGSPASSSDTTYLVTSNSENNHFLKDSNDKVVAPDDPATFAWLLAEVSHRKSLPHTDENSWNEQLKRMPPIYLIRNKANGEKVADFNLLREIAYLFALRKNCKAPLRLNKRSKYRMGTTSFKKVLSRLEDLLKKEDENMNANHVREIKKLQDQVNRSEEQLKKFLTQSEAFLVETLCLNQDAVVNNPDKILKQLHRMKKAISQAKGKRYKAAQKAIVEYTKPGAGSTPLTDTIPAPDTVWNGINVKSGYKGLKDHVATTGKQIVAADKALRAHENTNKKDSIFNMSRAENTELKTFPLIYYLRQRLQDVIATHAGGGTRAMMHRIQMVKTYQEVMSYALLFTTIAYDNVRADANKERFNTLGSFRLGDTNDQVEVILKSYKSKLTDALKETRFEEIMKKWPGKLKDFIEHGPTLAQIVIATLRANDDDRKFLRSQVKESAQTHVRSLQKDEDALTKLQEPNRKPNWFQKLPGVKRAVTAGTKDNDFISDVVKTAFRRIQRMLETYSALKWTREFKTLAPAAQAVTDIVRTMSGTKRINVITQYFPAYHAIKETSKEESKKNATKEFGRVGKRGADGARIVTHSKYADRLKSGQSSDLTGYTTDRYDRNEMTKVSQGVREAAGYAAGRRRARRDKRLGRGFASDSDDGSDFYHDDDTGRALREEFYPHDDEGFTIEANSGYASKRDSSSGRFYTKRHNWREKEDIRVKLNRENNMMIKNLLHIRCVLSFRSFADILIQQKRQEKLHGREIKQLQKTFNASGAGEKDAL